MNYTIRIVALAAVAMAIVGLLALAATVPAEAQQQPNRRIICSVWEEMKEAFRKKHGEETIALGVSDKGRSRVEVLASPEGDTFSVFIVYPEGVGCLIASGRGWETMAFPTTGDDET